MTLIQSLEEIRTYGREWAALPTKAARAIPAEDIMHLFVAANKFVPELLQHYAQLYGFPNYSGASVDWLRRAAGLCYNRTNIIKIDFLHVLFADDVALNATLLHELCHTEVHNHTIAFWMLFDQKLKEASIIDRGDDSRKKWLESSRLQNQDATYLYDTPGYIYENASDHKRKTIRDKVCYGFSQDRQWMMRSNQQYISDIYKLMYNLVDERKWLPEIIENILTGNCKLLTTFDYAEAIAFFKDKQLVETYVGYGKGDTKVADAFHEIFETIRNPQQYKAYRDDVRISCLPVFSANAGSVMPLKDIDRMLNDKYFTDIQMHSPIFIENPNLEMDLFCAHLFVATEYSCSR